MLEVKMKCLRFFLVYLGISKTEAVFYTGDSFFFFFSFIYLFNLSIYFCFFVRIRSYNIPSNDQNMTLFTSLCHI